jgi:hypothetical protein
MVEVFKQSGLNVSFRLFLLESMNGRWLAVSDLRKLILIDYPSRNISYQRLYYLLEKMRQGNLIIRQSVDNTLQFTTAKEGKHRIEYYKEYIAKELSGGQG